MTATEIIEQLRTDKFDDGELMDILDAVHEAFQRFESSIDDRQFDEDIERPDPAQGPLK